MTKTELLELGPNPARIRETIKEVRESVHVKDQRIKIDFAEHKIVRSGPADHPCGTVACHGGIFALALCEHENEYIQSCEPLEFHLHWARDPEGYEGPVMRFEDGANEFAKRIYAHVHADFIDSETLVQFMERNPSVWGNEHAGGIFDSYGHASFDKEFDDCDIDDILDWWLDVAARKEAWDARRGIVYPASQTYPEPRIS